MKRLIWLTDIHLNFVEQERQDEFLRSVSDECPDGVIVTGDIAEAPSIEPTLEMLASAWQLPIYFVLGNHDFYHGSIVDVRSRVASLAEYNNHLEFLTAGEVISLSDGIGLLGHDGWADAREGNYQESFVMLNDYRLIHELSNMTKAERWPVLQAMGDSAAETTRRQLMRALDRWDKVIFATHVPPFREACWHEGRISDDEWAPHFTCQAMGQSLVSIMTSYPDKQLVVLCGHTHGEGVTRPLPNLVVYTGRAVYGSPEIVAKVICDGDVAIEIR